ncbi:chromosomal protein D1-like [Drosophila innubila]|uniref:chromosomal protein D1-like n=1 Tax=Drosophila innubila TaxID=198719 RepID=UPI00148C8139|nr:chromosomal protein D1-like [Drosophila innubila]
MVDIAVPKKRGRPSKGGTTGAAPAASSPIETIPKMRGRPSKAKGRGRPPRVANELDEVNGEQPIKVTSTGKGRGRPRKEPITVRKICGSDDDNDADLPENKLQKKKQTKSSPVGDSDEHEDDNAEKKQENEERRPVGRPSTGAFKWNIGRIGRKVGRPKKNQPASEKKVNPYYVPTGRPRGRPKINKTSIEVAPKEA